MVVIEEKHLTNGRSRERVPTAPTVRVTQFQVTGNWSEFTLGRKGLAQVKGIQPIPFFFSSIFSLLSFPPGWSLNFSLFPSFLHFSPFSLLFFASQSYISLSFNLGHKRGTPDFIKKTSDFSKNNQFTKMPPTLNVNISFVRSDEHYEDTPRKETYMTRHCGQQWSMHMPRRAFSYIHLLKL